MAIDYSKRPQPSSGPSKGQSGQGGTPVRLSKVTLTKSAPSVSLTKQGSASGVLRVNLNWNQRPSGGGGLFQRSSGAIDLDLGCLYEYADGSKGAVQALGNAFTDQHTFGGQPICWLDGDDRSGANSAGENLYVNLANVNQIRRIMVYAFIYEGVPNWAAADGLVTLFPVSGPQIEVRLDQHANDKIMCGIAMLENIDGELSVRREVRYFNGHDKLDEAYGWGMRWQRGRK